MVSTIIKREIFIRNIDVVKMVIKINAIVIMMSNNTDDDSDIEGNNKLMIVVAVMTKSILMIMRVDNR